MSMLASFDAIAQSNIPVREKSAIRKWVEKTLGVPDLHQAVGYATEAAHTFRATTESAGTGLGLAYISASRKEGLDTKFGPIDGAVAAAGIIGSVFAAGMPMGVSQDLRNVGTNALAILTFRKYEAYKKKQDASKGGSTAHGDESSGRDPILSFSEENL